MTRPHFLGHEPSQAPVVIDLLRATRALAATGLGDGAVSARYGNRFVVNAAGVPLDVLGGRHFVEVVDYDPQNDVLLVIGEHAPHARANVSALVYRAKKEVGAIVHVALPDGHPVLARIPEVAKGRTPIETALSVLEAIRGASVVALGRDALAVGADVERARAALEAALGGGPR